MADERNRVIEQELLQVRQKAENIEGLTLVASVPALVRASIVKTPHKQLIVHMQFPENYPHEPVVIELRSKTLSEKFLDGMLKICEEEARKNVGQKQVLLMFNFIKTFIVENPLCVCSDDISLIKRNLITEPDKIILKQKNSQVVIKGVQEKYFMNLRITVPDLYPTEQVEVEVDDTNFPRLLRNNFQAQSVEISRKCVQPPLKPKPKDPPFKPRPSLYPVCEYLIQECLKKYPLEKCPLCREKVLPQDPEAKSADPKKRIERVYCGHLFHNGCLDTHMKTPPFTGGKKCPSCRKQIFHEKWKLTPELAESRWAHKQARQRELAEVVDFLE